MPTINGINSDDFSRGAVVENYLVQRFFGITGGYQVRVLANEAAVLAIAGTDGELAVTTDQNKLYRMNGVIGGAVAILTSVASVPGVVTGTPGAQVNITATQVASGNAKTDVVVQAAVATLGTRLGGDLRLSAGVNTANVANSGSVRMFAGDATATLSNLTYQVSLNNAATSDYASVEISAGAQGNFLSSAGFTFSNDNGPAFSFTGDLIASPTRIGFFGATEVEKPTVTGSRGGNAALASLLTAMANLGLITNSTSA